LAIVPTKCVILMFGVTLLARGIAAVRTRECDGANVRHGCTFRLNDRG
jgi:hypothetical protein